ncbi:hypothetical protein MKZ15_20835 [Paenibacillus sp. FSL R7-0216]|uniref:hypothetical protein n=1 Tax=Paenibacillus sp. FSL R7-0216 TaxID=2921677 RepID=UPI0030DD9015
MDKLNFDEEQLKKRIKERILYKADLHFPEKDTRPSDSNASLLRPLIESHNILEVEYFSHRKFLGKFIVMVKKGLRKLLRPIFMRQIHFNQKVIDHFYVVDHNLSDTVENVKGTFKRISEETVDEIVDELKGSLQEVVASNAESIRRYYEHELQSKVDMQIHEQVQKLKSELHVEIKSNVYRDLALYAGNHYNEIERYHLLLLALREDPDNLELEKEVLEAFERMNISRLKTNGQI